VWCLWSHIPVYTFSYGSFNTAIISSACPASNGLVIVNNELQYMCENMSQPSMELLSQHLHGGPKEKVENFKIFSVPIEIRNGNLPNIGEKYHYLKELSR